jgi:hypothetical protein
MSMGHGRKRLVRRCFFCCFGRFGGGREMGRREVGRLGGCGKGGSGEKGREGQEDREGSEGSGRLAETTSKKSYGDWEGL